ncbi:YbhN family protein [candidate division KSB1 bacterium]
MNTQTGTYTINKTKIITGIKIFFALTVIGSIVLLYRSSFSESLIHLRSFKLQFLAIAVLLILFDWLISGLRIFIYARKVYPSIRFFGCIRASLANIFMGGVTPSQTAGGPGQIYVLYKEGMSILDATVVSFLGFVNTVIVLPVTGILINIYIKPDIGNDTLRVLSKTTFLLFGLIFLAAFLALISPGRFESGVHAVLRRIPVVGRRFDRSKPLETLFESFKQYRNICWLFFRDNLHIVAAGISLTAVIYFNKFVIAWIVLQGLGIEYGFWQVIYFQLLLFLIFYFSPTPGASGVAEVSTALVMGHIVPGSFMGIFVVLWRFFTLYISMLAGAFVIVRYLLKKDN